MLDSFRIAGGVWLRQVDLICDDIPNVVRFGFDNEDVERDGVQRDPMFTDLCVSNLSLSIHLTHIADFRNSQQRKDFKNAFKLFKSLLPDIYKRLGQSLQYGDDKLEVFETPTKKASPGSFRVSSSH